MAAALLAALSMSAACSPASVRTSVASRALILTFTGLAGEPDTLNPLLSASNDLQDFSHLYISYLVEVNDRGEFVPEIAAVVPTRANGGISADGLTITYHLRRGIRWQDGAPLSARDVVFTYHAVMNPLNNLPTRVGYDHIKDVSAVGDDEVIVRLAKPFSPIIAYFEAGQGPTGVLPAHILEGQPDINHAAFNTLPIGSGPFRVVEWEHGDHVTLAANPLYWRGKPKIAQIVYKIIPDHNTQVEALQTHEVDAYFGVDPQLLPQVRALPGLRLTFTPITDFHDLHFNLRDPIVADVRVRRAIAAAIDRSQLIAVATHGAGIATDGDQPVLSWAHDPGLPATHYRPAVARALLDQAGWVESAQGVRQKMGRPLQLGLAISPAGVGGSRLVAQVIQEDLRRVGIQTIIKEYPPGIMWGTPRAGGVLSSGNYQMAYDAWWVLGPDPDDSWQFGCDQIPPAGENFYFWCNPTADRAMHDALDTFGRGRRKHDYAVVQREFVRDVPLLPLWQVKRPDAYTWQLHGISPSPAGSTFWNAWSWTFQR